jgi:hypothetical protein
MKTLALIAALLTTSAFAARSIQGECVLKKTDGFVAEKFAMKLEDPAMRFGVFAEGKATTLDVNVLLSNYQRNGDMSAMVSFPDGWSDNQHVHIVGVRPARIRIYSHNEIHGSVECKLVYRP